MGGRLSNDLRARLVNKGGNRIEVGTRGGRTEVGWGEHRRRRAVWLVYLALRFLVVEVVHVESKGGDRQTGEAGFFWLWFWIWSWRATEAMRSPITVMGTAIGEGRGVL